MTRRTPDWERGKTPRLLASAYAGLDETLRFMSFWGYRPAWYLEWYARPPWRRA